MLPGVAHHVIQRGNSCQDIFFVADDRRVRPVPPGHPKGGTRTNPLRTTVGYGKLTPPGETEANSAGEQPIAPTGTFRSADRWAKG